MTDAPFNDDPVANARAAARAEIREDESSVRIEDVRVPRFEAPVPPRREDAAVGGLGEVVPFAEWLKYRVKLDDVVTNYRGLAPSLRCFHPKPIVSTNELMERMTGVLNRGGRLETGRQDQRNAGPPLGSPVVADGRAERRLDDLLGMVSKLQDQNGRLQTQNGRLQEELVSIARGGRRSADGDLNDRPRIRPREGSDEYRSGYRGVYGQSGGGGGNYGGGGTYGGGGNYGGDGGDNGTYGGGRAYDGDRAENSYRNDAGASRNEWYGPSRGGTPSRAGTPRRE